MRAEREPAAAALGRDAAGPAGPARPALDGLLVAAAFVLGLALYAATLFPDVGPSDCGELCAAAWSWSVAHPPGFPAYTLCGWLWMHALPFGEPAWRLNLFSAACGAATAALVLRAALLWARAHGAGAGDARWIAATVALALLAGPVHWHWATLSEVYALETLVVGLVLALVLGARPRGTALVAAGVAFGVGLALHYSSTLMSAPLLLVWVLAPPDELGRGRLGAALRRGAVVAGASLAVALLLYATLLWRADATRIPNWGDPSDLGRLWRQVSAQQYRTYLVDTTGSERSELFAKSARLLWNEYTPLGLLLGAAGWIACARHHARLALGALGVLTLTALYNGNYFIDVKDREAYHLPLFLVLALGIARSLAALVRAARRSLPESAAASLPAGLFLAACLLPFLRWRESNHARHDVHSELARSVLRALPRDALLLTGDFELASPCMYLQGALGQRPDVTVVDIDLFKFRPWYVDMLVARDPRLAAWEPELGAFLHELRRFEAGELAESRAISDAWSALLARIVAPGERPFCVDFRGLGMLEQQRVAWDGLLVPEGFVFRLQPERPASLSELDWRPRLDLVLEPSERFLYRQYAAMLDSRAALATDLGREDAADEAIALARALVEAAR